MICSRGNCIFSSRSIMPESFDYEQMVQLRIKELLDPIGIPGSYIQPAKEKEDLLIGAFEENELVGCCILTKINEHTIQLRQMAVRNAHRGRRIGAAII